MGTKGTAVADVVSVLSLVLSAVWIVILVAPVNWHQATVNSVFRFETSLHQVKVSNQAEALSAQSGVSKEVLISEGTWNLQDARTTMCKEPSSHCDAFSKLLIASWGMMIAGCFVVLCLWLSAGFMLYFWHVDSTESGRKVMKVINYLGPLAACISVTAYFLLTKGFGDVENRPGFWVAASLTALSGVPLAVFEVLINHDAMHRVHERRVQKELLLKEYGDKHHMYGGTSTSPGELGWQPQMPAWRSAPADGSDPPIDPFLAGQGSDDPTIPQHWKSLPKNCPV
jgi:hypothetical protein